jgi:hypothetical protein
VGTAVLPYTCADLAVKQWCCGTGKFENGSGFDILSEYGFGSGSGFGSSSGSGSSTYICIYEYVYIYVYTFANVYVYTF